MRPLALVLAAVMTVAAAYAVVFWRNTSDVREQMEAEQDTRSAETLQFDNLQRDPSSRYQAPPSAAAHPEPPSRSPSDPGVPTPEDSGNEDEPSDATETKPLLDSEMMPTPQEESAPDQDAEKNELNYAALERTVQRIGSDIQRQMRRGEILRRGRHVGTAFLQYMGYTVNGSGEHVTPDGSFTVDVRGPDLIVVAGISSEFGNELEMTIIGPRDVDMRMRRLR